MVDSRSGLIELVEELVDAHLDTIEMALELKVEGWGSHVEYLQALRRHANSLVSELAADPTTP
jgi:hypothetical protein